MAIDGQAAKSIDQKSVETTIKLLSKTVVDTVRWQLLAGIRPNEVVLIPPCGIDRTGKVWES